jgi:guanylate kinase
LNSQAPSSSPGRLFIVSAPSGSGKSTLVNELRSQVRDLDFSVSYTTRAPRGSEQDGREYHFTTRKQFEKMLDENAFLEHAEVFGNFYGTAAESVAHAARSGKDLILDIDIQGARQVMARTPDAVTIFIVPPSREVLERRLRQRSIAEDRVAEDVVERRLAQASSEIQSVRDYRYAVVNDSLEDAVAELRAIVLFERGKRDSTEGDLSDIEQKALNCLTANRSPHLRQALARFGVELQGARPEV